jgi:SnoaL-like domain
MSSNQQFLQNLYEAFNKGEIETIISVMRPDVKWANGVEGGFVYGRDAVREYWTNQYNAEILEKFLECGTQSKNHNRLIHELRLWLRNQNNMQQS